MVELHREGRVLSDGIILLWLILTDQFAVCVIDKYCVVDISLRVAMETAPACLPVVGSMAASLA